MKWPEAQADGSFRTTLGAALKAAHRITELVPHTWIAGLGHDVRDVFWSGQGIVVLEIEDMRLYSFDSSQEILVDGAGEAVIRDIERRQFQIGFEMVRPLQARDVDALALPK